MSEPVRWNQATFDAHMAKFHPNKPVEVCQSPAKPKKSSSSARTQPTRGVMNKVETAYAAMLEELKLVGQVKTWRFEAVTLKLAEGCRYTPDFQIVMNDGRINMVEVKVRWRTAKQRGPNMEADARVKLLTAARLFPEFTFELAWFDGVAWHVEQIEK